MSVHSPGPRDSSAARRAAVAPLLIAGVFWGGVEAAVAQLPGRDTPLEPAEELFRRPTEITPRSGPPGTEVTVKGLHLPAITPVNLAFGGTRSGFEGLSFVLTSREGVIEEVVKVPDWASPEQVHRFIIFNAYFDPISMTDLFHVTDAEGKIRREGEVVEVGPTCSLILGQALDRYSLVGVTDGLEVGQRVRFEGTVVESSQCGDETHVEVVRLDPRG